MSIKSKLQQALNSTPRRVAAISGIAALVLIPTVIYAWGPESRATYTMAKPADKVTFDSITDNPDVGDERNFVRLQTVGEKTWSDQKTMEAGKQYYARMYVHNNAASNLNLVATNVRASLNLPNASNVWGKQFEVNGFITSDNATPNQIWDNVVLKSDREFHVKVVSAKYYNNIKTENSEGFDLGGSLFSKEGALLGYEQMDGKIPGCLKYSGYVLVKFEPVFKKSSYDVDKTVDKTTAKPGETINYTIHVKNTGDTDITNVKVTDKLPAYYSETKETIKSQNATSGSILKGDNTVTFSKLAKGETATITISYTIKPETALECGATKIANIVTSTSDQVKNEDNKGNNEADTTVNKECQPEKEKKPAYDIDKKVSKTAAKPGDTIIYTVTVRNTGELDLTNVKVGDKLPAYYSTVDVKTDAPSEVKGDMVKDGEITITKMPVGSKAVITITYTIKPDKDMACGDTIIDNQASGTTDQTQTEDDTTNNEAKTTVTRTCEPAPKEEEHNDNVTPATPATPQQQAEQPATIAETGLENTLGAVISLGVLAAAVATYIDSRKIVK